MVFLIQSKITVGQLIKKEFGIKEISEETLGPILKKNWDESGVTQKVVKQFLKTYLQLHGNGK